MMEGSIPKIQDSLVKKKPKTFGNRYRFNQQLYMLFAIHDFENANKIIIKLKQEFGEFHEFGNLIEGYIQKMNGNLNLSIETFRSCLSFNDKDPEALKNISKNLQLQGRYKASVEVAQEAQKITPLDWELYYILGNCYSVSKDQNKAISYYLKSLEYSKNEIVVLQLGRLYCSQEKYEEAANLYQQAIHHNYANQDIKAVYGTLLLRLGETKEAYKILEQAQQMDPNDSRSLLGLGSILQDRGEMDKSLNYYRKLVQQNPFSGQIWNNVGMCFLSQGKKEASLVCLRKALYFEPFEWIISFNLGLAYLNCNQYASAFHFFQAAISLNPEDASCYMYLGIALDKLNDEANAQRSFERAIEIEEDYLIYINYAIVLLRRGNRAKAQENYNKFSQIYSQIKGETRLTIDEIEQKRDEVKRLLK